MASRQTSSVDKARDRIIAPRQQRSRDTLHRLLDAAEALLNERVLDEITVSDIVSRAGSSVGSFYARFPCKEALVTELLRRYHEDAEREIAALPGDDPWKGLDLEGRARVLVERVVHVCRRRRGLLRLRLQRRITPGQGGLPEEEEWGERIVSAMRELFRPVQGEIRHPDAEAALSFALRIVDGVVLSSILLDTESGAYGRLDDAPLVDRLVEAFTGYLKGC
jgi:AcrR family transcriptional regulator